MFGFRVVLHTTLHTTHYTHYLQFFISGINNIRCFICHCTLGASLEKRFWCPAKTVSSKTPNTDMTLECKSCAIQLKSNHIQCKM